MEGLRLNNQLLENLLTLFNLEGPVVLTPDVNKTKSKQMLDLRTPKFDSGTNARSPNNTCTTFEGQNEYKVTRLDPDPA